MRALLIVSVLLVGAWVHVALEFGLQIYSPTAPVASAQFADVVAACAFASAAIVPVALLCMAALRLWTFAGGSAFARVRLLVVHDPHVRRVEVVRIHAEALALVLAASAGAGFARWLVSRLWRLQAAALAQELLWVAVVTLILAVPIFVWPLARLLRWPLERFDQRWPLPRPRSLALRYVLFVVAPTLVVLVPTLRQWHRLLSWRASLVAQLVTVALAGAVAIAWRDWLSPRAQRRAAVVVVILALGSVGYAACGSSTPATLSGALGRSWLSTLTDVDRDGASAWFGEGDCAPFDESRGPLSRDVPGNGIDEDCDGVDAPRALMAEPRLSPNPPDLSGYDIVWIIVDGLRADHTTAHGYSRETTPYLTRFAARSVDFRRAYAQSSATAFSFASLFTGRRPAALRWRPAKGTPQLDPAEQTVAQRLRERGYRTALFTTAWFARTYPGLLAGYEDVVTATQREGGDRLSPETTSQAIRWIERGDGPMFATIYYHDPHYPYVRHPEAPNFGERPIDLYDSDIAFADRYIGFLLSHLKQRSWDRTIVIVTADHGEEFGEHGGRHHARTCHVESTHVPLWLRVPGVVPRVVDAPVALTDIAVTTLELVGATDDALHGHSLLLSPNSRMEDRPIFCSVVSQFEQPRFFRRAVRTADRALHLDVLSGQEALYNVARDPQEQTVLPQRDERLRQLLSGSHEGNLGAAQLR